MIDGVWTQRPGPARLESLAAPLTRALPSAPLSDACPVRFAHSGTRLIRVAADGCADLILHERAGQLWVTRYEPTTKAIVVALDAATTMHGVRMRPGFGGGLLRDGVVALALARAERGVALATIACELCVAPPALIEDFVASAAERNGAVRVDQLTRDTASERRLERAARQHLGLTPKGYLRIVRAQAARSLLAHEPAVAVAADLGFADQAHLSRELATVIGLTPRVLSEMFKTPPSRAGTMSA